MRQSPPARWLSAPRAGSVGAAVRRKRGTGRGVTHGQSRNDLLCDFPAGGWPGELTNKLLDDLEPARPSDQPLFVKQPDTQPGRTFTWRADVRGYDHKRPTSGVHHGRPDT